MKRNSAYLENDDGMVAKRPRSGGAGKRWKVTPKGRAALSAWEKAQMARIAKSVLNRTVETKWDYFNNASVITSTGSVFEPHQLVRGDGVADFEGAKIKPKYLTFKGRLLCPAVSTGSVPANQYIGFRFVVFQWKPDLGSDTPTLGEILNNPSGLYSMVQYNADNRSTFKVLYDCDSFVVNSAGNPDCTKSIAFTVPGSAMLPIQYNTGAVSGENHIYFCLYSTEATNGPQFVYESKLAFTDA